MENKERSSEITSIMKDLENEFGQYARENSNNILISNKMKSFIEVLNEKTMKKCGNELKELEKYMKIENQQVSPLPGKENEAQKAAQDLNNCQGNLLQLYMGITTMSQYNNSILALSVNSCVDECETNIKDQNSTLMKNCVRNCYNFNFNHTLKAIENLFSSQLDSAIEEMKKF